MYKIPEDLESKYAFVSLASSRAEQLQSGALPRVTMPSRKVTIVAQAEVAEGLVEPIDPAALDEGIEAEEE